MKSKAKWIQWASVLCAVIAGYFVFSSLKLQGKNTQRFSSADAEPKQANQAEMSAKRVGQAKPWLGIVVELGKEGVLIKDVINDTPAQKSGLKNGDEVLSVDGNLVKQPAELVARIGNAGVGNEVSLNVTRNGKSVTLKIRLVARPDELDIVRKKLMGKPISSIELEKVPGPGKAALNGFPGKVVIVEFWATWCPACKSTHPRLNQITKDFAAKGIEIVGVSNEETNDIESYRASSKLAFQILRDPKDKLHMEMGVTAIPMIVVIDKKGIVQFVTIGGGSDLEEAIAFAESIAVAELKTK